MVLEGRIGIMLKKLGQTYTFYHRGTVASSDTFYKDETVVWTTVTLRAIVFPARAYDVHSNSLHLERPLGIESVGIIDVFVDKSTCTVDVDDYVSIGGIDYKLKSKEIFGDAYYVFEAHLDTRPT